MNLFEKKLIYAPGCLKYCGINPDNSAHSSIWDRKSSERCKIPEESKFIWSTRSSRGGESLVALCGRFPMPYVMGWSAWLRRENLCHVPAHVNLNASLHTRFFILSLLAFLYSHLPLFSNTLSISMPRKKIPPSSPVRASDQEGDLFKSPRKGKQISSLPIRYLFRLLLLH